MLRHVMVIDDSDPDLLYTRIVLERSGAVQDVLPFESAADALDYLKTSDGDAVSVILLDINMPEMDGFEFLQRYEAECGGQPDHPVVVMLTSSPDPSDRERAFSFPSVRGYVVKPIEPGAARGLVDVVEQATRATR